VLALKPIEVKTAVDVAVNVGTIFEFLKLFYFPTFEGLTGLRVTQDTSPKIKRFLVKVLLAKRYS